MDSQWLEPVAGGEPAAAEAHSEGGAEADVVAGGSSSTGAGRAVGDTEDGSGAGSEGSATTREVDTRAVARGDARVRARVERDAGSGSARPGSAEDLSSARLLRPVRRAPASGWRRVVYVGSGGALNPGESPAEAARRELIGRVNQPVSGCYKIAMLSLKGGVGKTSMTVCLGSTLASLRGDRVIAVDANPDRGTLAQRIPLETTATVRHLLRDADRVRRYADVRAYTSQGPSRLEVLASEQDPAVSEAFGEGDYRRVADLVGAYFTVMLTDCGTGLMHSAMRGVLNLADSLLVVSSASIDGARSASATLDWLDAHGYRSLVSRSIAVVNGVPRRPSLDLQRVRDHFAMRCRAVVQVPQDRHLSEGGEVHLEQLHTATREALLEMAAAVADDFPRTSVLGPW